MSSVALLERAGAERDSALARCAGEVSAFLEDTWGRRALVHRRADAGGFADLLSLDEVDRIVSTTSLRTPSFRLVKAGETIPESAYTRSGTTGSRPVSGMADPARVFELFRGGATIVLQGLHRYHEPVTRFVRALELELGHPCQANAYITPPGAQGLDLHHDPHDVFVLQAFGHKSWEVHAAPAEPDRDPFHAEVGPGDAIYLPTGTPHAAQTQDSVSGHLTVGVHTTTWGSLLAAAWGRVAGDPSFEDPLPAGWTRDVDAVAGELAERLSAASAALGRADASDIVRERAIAFASSRAALLRGALVDQLDLDRVGDDTVLERRPGSICELHPRGERLLALLGDRRLDLPAWLEPAMRRVLAEPAVRVGDLASEIPDEPSRSVLARRLVREGLLRPVR